MPSARRVRVAFWVLLGLFSTALAEVPSGSSPFVFLSPWGLVVTLPLYLLHATVLAGIVYRYGRPSLRALLVAGGLFGLYEAYVTKVLWMPTWEPLPVRAGGVYLFETANLLLLWHPVASFVLPLLAVERLATRSRTVPAALPDALTRRPTAAAIGVALAFGCFQAAVLAGRPTTVVLADLSALAVLGVAVALWRRRVGTVQDLPSLLPTRDELAVLGALLALVYLVLGAAIRPGEIPSLDAQATVWGVYAVVTGLLVVTLRAESPAGADGTSPVRLRQTLAVVVPFVGVAAVGSVLLGPAALAVFLGTYALSVLVGVVVYGGALVDLGRTVLGRPRPWGSER